MGLNLEVHSGAWPAGTEGPKDRFPPTQSKGHPPTPSLRRTPPDSFLKKKVQGENAEKSNLVSLSCDRDLHRAVVIRAEKLSSRFPRAGVHL